MSTNWIAVIIFYAWLLTGLFTVKKLKNIKKPNQYQLLGSFFIGPFGLGWIWVQENRDKIQQFFQSRKTKKEENTDYLNLVFLDSHGRDLFAGKAENSQIVDLVKKMVYEAVTRHSSDVFIDPKDDAYVVRFRVDGMIRIYDTMPKLKN